MNGTKLHGIIPPVVTPLFDDESLNLPRLASLIDEQLSYGVHGIFVLGTTGEFFSFDEVEKQAITATAVEAVRGRVPVYVGTGAVSTREVVRLTAMAERESAQGVSIITPYFIKPTQAEMLTHFKAVAASTSLDVILYNNPGVCNGLNLEPATVAALAEVPNIVGIKDSWGDMQQVFELREILPADFGVMVGKDTLILSGLLAGAAGAIPAACNVVPELCVGIYECFRRGDLVAARAFQDRLAPVRRALNLGTGNGAVKEALAMMGRSAGPNRAPIADLPPSKREALRLALHGAGLLG